MPADSKQKAKSTKKRAGKTPDTKVKQLSPGEWFEKLVAAQTRLRAPKGCPWDREQTHQTLRTYLLEEAYAVMKAIKTRHDMKSAAAMGNMLLQLVFLSQLGSEERRLPVADVIRDLHYK